MKHYKCCLSSDTKVLSAGGQQLEFRNNQIYKESVYTKTFPSLFKEVDSVIDVVKKEPKKKSTSSSNDITKTNNSNKPKDTKKKLSDISKTNTSQVINQETKSKFNMFRFLLLGVSMILIAVISAYLRVHGIMSVFDVSLITAFVLVIGFLSSEFAISSLMLREITSKLHHYSNMVILGIVQLVLISIAFIFEFSTMSNYINKQKVDRYATSDNIVLIKESISDYDNQIQNIQKQIDITPKGYITKRSKLTNQLNNIIIKKDNVRDRLSNIINNKENIQLQKDGVGFENTAKLLGVSENTITKTIIIFLAGILNVLYLSFMYGFITEWKRRK